MSQYSRGANFERRIMGDYKKRGWDVFRSAGSHGAADVLVARYGEVIAIQAQIDGYFAPAKRMALLELIDRHKWQGVLAWREGKKLKMEFITND